MPDAAASWLNIERKMTRAMIRTKPNKNGKLVVSLVIMILFLSDSSMSLFDCKSYTKTQENALTY